MPVRGLSGGPMNCHHWGGSKRFPGMTLPGHGGGRGGALEISLLSLTHRQPAGPGALLPDWMRVPT